MLLFQGFLSSPSSEGLKDAYARQLKAKQEQFKDDSLRKIGYTDEDIKMIRAQMEQADLGSPDSYLLGG
jgi:5-bromo-4-chloroindolyl phosphate hydrolysis protein